MDFEVNNFTDRERKIATLRLKSIKKLKRIYTNTINPITVQSPQTDGQFYNTKITPGYSGGYKDSTVNKQIMGYVGKGPYINTEVLAPLLTEDINLYYPNTTYHHRIRPDIYCLPFLAKQYFRQDGWPAKIENFTHAPSTQPLNPVELPIYPFSPKFRANLCSFQDENGVHLIHSSGEIVNDLCISDLGKYGDNISVNTTYKCPKNIPGFIQQLQLTTELQKKRLLVQQMYHSSVLEIDNNDDQTFKIEPLEVLKFSSKIADTTMYKYTGSVVTLLEKGELILWNGERSVRLLHKPVLESPAYRHRNYARKFFDARVDYEKILPMKTPIVRRCTFTEHENSVLVSAHDNLFLFDFRQKLSTQKPLITLTNDTPIYGLKHNPYEPFQFAITSPLSANIFDQRFVHRPLHSWDVLLETDPHSNIEFFPRNEYCIDNPFDGLISWTESGDVLLYPYENKQSWLQDVVAQYDRTPLSIPAFNNFGELSYPGVISELRKYNRNDTGIRYSPDTQIHGIHLSWYKQIHDTLKDTIDHSIPPDIRFDDEDSDYISPSQILFLQLSSMGDMYSELFSFTSSSSIISNVWCDFKARNEEVLRRIDMMKVSECKILNIYNITGDLLDIVNKSESNDSTQKDPTVCEIDINQIHEFLKENWKEIVSFLSIPKSLRYVIWGHLNQIRKKQQEKLIPIESIKEFLLSRSCLLYSNYFDTPKKMFQKDPLYQMEFDPDAEIYVYRIRNIKSRKLDYSPSDFLDESFYDEDEQENEEGEDSFADLNDSQQNSRSAELKAKVNAKIEHLSLVFYERESYHLHFPDLLNEYAPEKKSLKVGSQFKQKEKAVNQRSIIGASGNYNLDILKLKRLWPKSRPSSELNVSSSFSFGSTPSTPFFSTPSQTSLFPPLKTPLTKKTRSIQTPGFTTPRTPSVTTTPSFSLPKTPSLNLSQPKSQGSQESIVSSQDYDSFMSLFQEDKSNDPQE